MTGGVYVLVKTGYLIEKKRASVCYSIKSSQQPGIRDIKKVKKSMEARFKFRRCSLLLNLDGAQVTLKFSELKRGEKESI